MYDFIEFELPFRIAESLSRPFTLAICRRAYGKYSSSAGYSLSAPMPRRIASPPDLAAREATLQHAASTLVADTGIATHTISAEPHSLRIHELEPAVDIAIDFFSEPIRAGWLYSRVISACYRGRAGITYCIELHGFALSATSLRSKIFPRPFSLIRYFYFSPAGARRWPCLSYHHSILASSLLIYLTYSFLFWCHRYSAALLF